jgi:uncharacterized membrane protein
VEIVGGVLLILALPIMAIAGFIMALGARARLSLVETRLQTMEGQLALLAAAPGAAAPAATPVAQPIEPAPAPQAASEPPPEIAPPSAAPAPAEPIVAPAPAPAAEPIGVPPMPPSALPPIRPAPPAGESLEERFGTRWVVWVGGLALALGGIFLVKYSIEAGLIGPGLRVFLGALLAAALIVGAEWARRREQMSGLPGLPAANIPAILTAAGTTVAYATVYAAYGLYGLIGPPIAFLLLGLVALATLAAALLHGPALAGLGVVGAYVTPLLVSTATPNYWALYIYIAVVTAAAFMLARARLWRWLALTAIVFGFLWVLPGLESGRDAQNAQVLHVFAGFALVAVLIVSGLLYGPPASPGRIDAVSSIGLAAYLTAAALMVVDGRHDALTLFTFSALVVATVAIAWRAEAAMAAVAAAAVLSALVIVHWIVARQFESLVAPGGPVAGDVAEPYGALYGTHLALGAGYAALFGAAGFFAQGRSERAVAPILWAASAVFAPIAILIALYYRVAGFERSIPFAGIALLAAALYATATEALGKREPRPGIAAAQALFATGAIAALALAFTFALEKGWLTVGLALMVPGIAYVCDKRPLPALRWLAAIVGLVVLARIGWEPRIVGSAVGATPIFNWLLYGYGVPALSFWVAGFLLRRRADDVPARMTDSLAILFTVLLFVMEIRHAINKGDVYRDSAGLAEAALQVSVFLAMAIGLERVRGRTGSIVHNIGALIVAGLALAGIVLGLATSENPLFTGDAVGGAFINLILLGYGLPAVLAITLALIARTTRPMPYRAVAAAVSVALALFYFTLEVRRLYHGPVLTLGETTGAEQYTYSAVWLAYGVTLLLVGILLRSQPARLASAAVILITIAKVFLVDMSGITGVFRALSFIVLGLVLVGIGWLYQRLLFPKGPPPGPAAATPAPPPVSAVPDAATGHT